MGRSVIPLRPKDFSSPLSQQEQACLTWFVLSGCTKKEAFVTFARPDMLGSKSKAAVDDFVKQFFARKESKEYISAYEDTLGEILKGKKRESRPDDGLPSRRKSRGHCRSWWSMSLWSPRTSIMPMIRRLFLSTQTRSASSTSGRRWRRGRGDISPFHAESVPTGSLSKRIANGPKARNLKRNNGHCFCFFFGRRNPRRVAALLSKHYLL